MPKSDGQRFPVLNWLDLSLHSKRSLSGDAADLKPQEDTQACDEVVLADNLQYFPVDRPGSKPASEGIS